jgi:hypothetical protein
MARISWRIILTVLLWFALSEILIRHSPIVDCYEVAPWNGRVFVGTGEWKCLK